MLIINSKLNLNFTSPLASIPFNIYWNQIKCDGKKFIYNESVLSFNYLHEDFLITVIFLIK